ncbi:hypothetical protein LCGC14_2221000 [marine sediment metagenome]|uniref:Uncharacterized protein n=1 Tax=marine sediment metagenome TaxID=412755 RepID=A0A0F9DYJ6_9ZZZZ
MIGENISFSPQVCQLAVGAAGGFGVAFGIIFKIGYFILLLYLIKKGAEVLINIFGNKKKKK